MPLHDLKVDVVREDWVKALLWCIFAVSAARGGYCEYCGEGGGGDYSLHDFLLGVLLHSGEEKGPADAGRFAGC